MTIPVWIKRIIARMEAGTNGYLPQVGWIETRARHQAIDAQNRAIPWFTYPAIALLAARVKPGWRVLEFGAGMGTIWWSRNGARVLALEHDENWHRKVADDSSASLIMTTAESAIAYLQPALNTGPYQAVIVDGLFRSECLAAACDVVSDDGIVILDDAERPEYKTAVEQTLNRGFRALELHGPQPVSKHPGCTTIFYRDANVLGL